MTAVGTVLAASVTWVALGAWPVPAAVQPRPTGGASVTADVQESPTDTVPLVADFDGDGRDDLLWYGPGAKDDHLWRGRPSRAFVGSPVTVHGSYLPLVGDFDGDRRGDVLWYGPGGQ